MAKRALQKYLQELKKEELEEQIMDLYHRFPAVKEYFDFSFNPKEEKLLEEAKLKISKEFFPLNGRKAKARRGVAQKLVKKYIGLGVDPIVIADVMLYSIEIAQEFNLIKPQKQEAFYKSMQNSFEKALEFIKANKIEQDFNQRLERIVNEAIDQEWYNYLIIEKDWETYQEAIQP